MNLSKICKAVLDRPENNTVAADPTGVDSMHGPGSYNPAAHLSAFLKQAGAPLSSVTSLSLLLMDKGSSTVDVGILHEALSQLVHACPMLASFTCVGCWSKAVLSALSEACPLLSELAVSAPEREEDLPYLQGALRLLPSLLPGITRLTLLSDSCPADYKLPDMSRNAQLRSLSLPGYELDRACLWRKLPPRLQHLRCLSVDTGPSVATHGAGTTLELLTHMQSITVVYGDEEAGFEVEVAAGLLRAMPNLQALQCGGAHPRVKPVLVLFLDPDTSPARASADLALLRDASGVAGTREAVYQVTCCHVPTRLLRPITAALPRMGGVTACRFLQCTPGTLSLLARVFPDAQDLQLKCFVGFDDRELQALVAYGQLTRLELLNCHQATPKGLISLCTLMPGLRRIRCHNCAKLRAPALEKASQRLLEQTGVHVEMEDMGQTPVLAYNSIGRLVLKQQVEHVAQLVANLDLICVKFHQVDDKPPGASALLEEAVFAIRGGELMITAARVAGGPLAGQRAHEVMRAYFSAMEPSIKSGENKTLLDVNGQARDSAIKVGKRLEKDALLAKEKEDLARKAATQPPPAARHQAQNFQQNGQQFSQNKRFHSNH
ncbi:MAG: hypothetical protein WDW38_002166 [Sanguina aurantia]